MSNNLTTHLLSGNQAPMAQFLVEAYEREVSSFGQSTLHISPVFWELLGGGISLEIIDDGNFWLHHLGEFQCSVLDQQRQTATLASPRIVAMCKFSLSPERHRFLLIEEVLRSEVICVDGVTRTFQGNIADLTDFMVRLQEAEASSSNLESANVLIKKRISKTGHDLRQLTQICTLHLDILASAQEEILPGVGGGGAQRKAPLAMLGRALENIDRLMVAMLDEFLTPENPRDMAVPNDHLMAPSLLQRESFSLKSLAARIGAEFAPQVTQKNLRLTVGGSSAFCSGTILKVERVLRNLIDNAVKFTPYGGRILVFCRTLGVRARIDVLNTGHGIDEDQKERIWEHRARGALHLGVPGSGIGLHTVHDLVKEMGGTIGCSSKMGRGARFWFELPAELNPISKKPITAPNPASAEVEAPYLLLIEDSLPVGAMVTQILKGMGCQVRLAGNTRTALQLVQNGPSPDAIIADFFLEDGTTGLDAIRLLREACSEGIPAILVTSGADPTVSRNATGMAVSILRKPTNKNDLKRRLLRWVPGLSETSSGCLMIARPDDAAS